MGEKKPDIVIEQVAERRSPYLPSRTGFKQ